MLRALLVFALTLPVAGCFDESPGQHVAAAKLALQKFDAKAALLELKSSLQRIPSNAEVRFLLGQACQSAEQWADSEAELMKAMQLGTPPDQLLPELAPHPAEARETQGCHRSDGRPQVLRTHPDDKPRHVGAGRSGSAEKTGNEMASWLENTIKVDSKPSQLMLDSSTISWPIRKMPKPYSGKPEPATGNKDVSIDTHTRMVNKSAQASIFLRLVFAQIANKHLNLQGW